MAFAAGSAGSLVGCTLAAPGAVAAMLLLASVFAMAATVGLQLLARPQPTTTMRGLPAGVPHPLRGLRQHLQRLGRYLQITRLAVHHGLGPYLGLGRARQSSATAVAAERRARLALEQAGGMFVKLGQMLSTRPDVVPPALAHELAGLQEQMTPADSAAVRALLEQELGTAMDAVFAAFDWTPVAAASIAQAHAARLTTGERVIVKVQRPGIDQLVEQDLAIVLHLARRIQARTSWGAAYGVADLAAEFADNLRQELDFQAEARNITEVAAGLADTPEIHLPTVYAQLSTKRVLVMEQLEGVSVGQTERLERLAVDREKLRRRRYLCSKRPELRAAGRLARRRQPGGSGVNLTPYPTRWQHCHARLVPVSLATGVRADLQAGRFRSVADGPWPLLLAAIPAESPRRSAGRTCPGS